MQVTLEGLTPYDRSVQWRFHDAYFAQRGIAAWERGDIPHHSTNNYAVARQHAELLLGLVATLEAAGSLAPGDPVCVMEIGGGVGRFAANLMRALESGTGSAGKDLAGRLSYLFTDFSDKSLREAAATNHLAPWVAAGRVRPALFDLRCDVTPRPLDGQPLDDRRPIALLSNYVACTAPTKQLQRRPDGWHELHVEIRAETDDASADPRALLDGLLADAARFNLLRNLAFFYEWKPTALDSLFEGPLHSQVITRVLDGLQEATLGYPLGYIDFLDRMRRALAPGGVFVITDYGNVAPARITGLRERRPQYYGNTVNHDVYFPLFTALAAETGMGVALTHDPLGSLHTAVIGPDGALPAPLLAAFEAAFAQRSDADDVLDFGHAGQKCLEGRDYGRAVRFYRRALALDVDSIDLCYRLGTAAIEAGELDLAIESLDRGLALSGNEPQHDFEFQLGRATCLRAEPEVAERWYRASLGREPHPVTFTNLAVILESLGRHEEAYRTLQQALALDPEHKRAHERLDHLKETWWQTLVERATRA